MESALAVEMVRDIENSGYKVASITMDEDSTTIARLHQEVNEEIIKFSDKNYVHKKFVLQPV